MIQFIHGKDIIAKKESSLLERISYITNSIQRRPFAVFIIVGDNESSLLYVKKKSIACKKYNIDTHIQNFPSHCHKDDIIQYIHTLNNNHLVDGILIQLPFPKQLQCYQMEIIECIDKNKDIDGLHSYHQGMLLKKQPSIIPCTALASLYIAKSALGENIKGLHCVIVGESFLAGRACGSVFLNEKCTVTITHKDTINIKKHCQMSDIFISAIGKPHLINSEWIRKTQLIIDIGISITKNNKVIGDVDINTVKDKCEYCTPVPKGIGPLTVFCFIENLTKLTERKIMPKTGLEPVT